MLSFEKLRAIKNSQPWTIQIKFTDSNTSHFIKTHFNIIPHLYLHLLSLLFCLGVYGKMLYTFIIFPVFPECVAKLIFHGYLHSTSSSAESVTSNDRVDNLLRFEKCLVGNSSLFADVTQHRVVVCNQPTLHNITEGRVSWFQHGGILKSLIFWRKQLA
jgi:hypothetical protein